jgi:HEAT repeat protein
LRHSPHAHIRANAANACGFAKDPAAVPALRRALHDESTAVRLEALRALVELEDARALPALVRWLNETREPTRGSNVYEARFPEFRAEVGDEYDEMGARLGGGSSCPGALPHPVVLSREKVRKILVDVLRRLGAEQAQEAYRLLALSACVEERLEAAKELGWAAESDRPASTAVLRHLATDPELTVRLHAALSLVLAGDLAGWPVLLGLSGRDEETRKAVWDAWYRLHDYRLPVLLNAAVEATFRARGLLGPNG